jgi:hypothetical protein
MLEQALLVPGSNQDLPSETGGMRFVSLSELFPSDDDESDEDDDGFRIQVRAQMLPCRKAVQYCPGKAVAKP